MLLKKAINNYVRGNFKQAITIIERYRNQESKDIYKKFFDNSTETIESSDQVLISIVIVTKSPSTFVKNLLTSLPDRIARCEIILIVNNSFKKNRIEILESQSINKIISLGENYFPSEARNMGALMSRGKWLYFVDDDASFFDSTISGCIDFINNFNYFACRGRVIAKKSNWMPAHYDMRDKIIPATLNVEGNFLIKRCLFLTAGGFDPLLFGHEGRDLTSRCIKLVNSSEIVYFPKLLIGHEPKLPGTLEWQIKEKRHAHANKYCNFKEINKLNSVPHIIVLLPTSLSGVNEIIESYLKTMDSTQRTFIIIVKYYNHEVHGVIRRFRGKARIYARSLSGVQNDPLFRSLDASIITYLSSPYPLKQDIIVDAISMTIKNTNIADLNNNNRYYGFCITRPLHSSWLAFDKDSERIGVMAIEKIKHSQFNIESNINQSFKANGSARSRVIFVSFYTNDKYYREKAVMLKKNLAALGVDFDIKEIIKPNNKEWPEICRMKIRILYDLFMKHRNNYEKIIWTDVDAEIGYIPWFIYDYDVDFMAFRRGFQKSYIIDRPKTRFWSPCFFVFKSSNASERFLSDAVHLEETGKDIVATDDYFFEEAWKRNKDIITYYPIPGEMSAFSLIEKIPLIQSCLKGIFYHSGDSGNVPFYKGKVQQHLVDENAVLGIPPAKKSSEQSLESLSTSMRHNGQLVLRDPIIVRSTGCSDNQRHWLDSRHAYEDNNLAELKLFWWTKPYPGNMGDWLSPYIISRLSGLSIKYANENDAEMISLGSIGKAIQPHHLVWGTGISTLDTYINPNATFLALRGPYTASALLKSGGSPPEVFGDPAIILPKIYQPKKHSVHARFALVRHYIHQDIFLNLCEDIEEVNILRSSPEDLENFIDDISSYEGVVTTSLHVTILCHSYGIPCRLVALKDQNNPVHGDGIKYRDFYEGVGLVCPKIPNLGNDFRAKDIEAMLVSEVVRERYRLDLEQVFMESLNNRY